MDPEIKIILQNMIKKNRLSSGVDDNSVWYTFRDEPSGNKVVLICQHAYNTSNEIFANYSVIIDSIPVVRCTLPTLNTFGAKKPDVIQIMETCAKKVIQQQKQMQDLQFLIMKSDSKSYS